MSSIYRFTSFQSLVDILQTGELTLVSPELWKDPYEGYIFTMAKSEEWQEKILKELQKKCTPELSWAILASLSIHNFAYFCQCWTKNPESDALWRIYSHDNTSIRIEVEREDFLKLEGVHVADVEYFSKIDVANEIQSIIESDGRSMSTFKALLSKRDAFEHEQEVRIIKSNFWNLINNQTQKPLSSLEIEQHKVWLSALVKSEQITPVEMNIALKSFATIHKPPDKVIRISFNGTPNFIKSVMLNPLSPRWLDETMSEFCRLNKINYLWKSTLYEFSI